MCHVLLFHSIQVLKLLYVKSNAFNIRNTKLLTCVRKNTLKNMLSERGSQSIFKYRIHLYFSDGFVDFRLSVLFMIKNKNKTMDNA